MTTKQKYTILLVLGGLSALGPFSIDMYLPAFKAIAQSLKTDLSHVGFTLTGYFIGISFGQLFYGPVTDRFGRKKPLIFGLSLYILASIGCALSPTIEWLIAMRVLLALGGCVGMVVGRAIVRDLFPVSEIAKIFSILMLIVGIAPIIAPTIGSWVLTVSEWRTIFYIMTSLGMILLFSVLFFLPESQPREASHSLSIPTIMKNYKEVLSDKTFIFYALIGSLAMSGMFAYISGSPFVFMEYFGISQKTYGLIFGFNAFGYILGSQVNRVMLNKFSSKKIVVFSAVALCTIGVSGIVLQNTQLLTVEILVAHLVCFLFCLGHLVPNATALALTPFTKNAGSASALIGFIQMVFGASMSSLVSFLADDSLFPMMICLFICGSGVFMLIGFVQVKNRKKRSGVIINK
ncbi:multidrug effflux MFS transporter [Myroides ceti]|uniref:Multidrug effflux MFS transporter n=1 Tax=Paenimyroides ceti TaxID=395087 RepID=A0ABT8CYI2_9FLAO|nr:multidrug effflux MFS transporter [Paenimyroides ceti]MDN3706462.1 multidrug effflux MFS transporter [Paenimyroides ceti]MDN3709166.1 multidrug effflux MFS transporter [Paenimyroides ceti]